MQLRECADVARDVGRGGQAMAGLEAGQVHDADDSAIGRFSSNVSPQARQRYS